MGDKPGDHKLAMMEVRVDAAKARLVELEKALEIARFALRSLVGLTEVMDTTVPSTRFAEEVERIAKEALRLSKC